MSEQTKTVNNEEQVVEQLAEGVMVEVKETPKSGFKAKFNKTVKWAGEHKKAILGTVAASAAVAGITYLVVSSKDVIEENEITDVIDGEFEEVIIPTEDVVETVSDVEE